MTFLSFFVTKLESVGLSEIVLQSFLDNDNSDYFLQKICTKGHQEIQSHLKDCRLKIPPKLMEVFRPTSWHVSSRPLGVGIVAGRSLNSSLSFLIYSVTLESSDVLQEGAGISVKRQNDVLNDKSDVWVFSKPVIQFSDPKRRTCSKSTNSGHYGPIMYF